MHDVRPSRPRVMLIDPDGPRGEATRLRLGRRGLDVTGPLASVTLARARWRDGATADAVWWFGPAHDEAAEQWLLAWLSARGIPLRRAADQRADVGEDVQREAVDAAIERWLQDAEANRPDTRGPPGSRPD